MSTSENQSQGKAHVAAVARTVLCLIQAESSFRGFILLGFLKKTSFEGVDTLLGLSGKFRMGFGR